MHPILFTIFDINVPSYGFFISLGLVACFLTWYALTKKKNMPVAVFDSYFQAALIAIVVGFGAAALFQGVYNCQATGEFEFGGITFMGGLIGGVAAFVAYFFLFIKDKKLKQAFWDLADIAAPCILIAHSLGRIGCLLAGCCYGAENEVWGFAYVKADDPTLRLPVQLYEAVFLFLLYAITLAYALKCKKRGYGISFYAIAYGIWRFFIEYLRDDYRGGADGAALSPSQVQSIVFIIVGIVYIVLVYLLTKKGIIASEIDWTVELKLEQDAKAERIAKKAEKEAKRAELKSENSSYEDYNEAIKKAEEEIEQNKKNGDEK